MEKVINTISNLISPDIVFELGMEELEDFIRPCGFCKEKAATIHRLAEWYGTYDYDVNRVNSIEQEDLRYEGCHFGLYIS